MKKLATLVSRLLRVAKTLHTAADNLPTDLGLGRDPEDDSPSALPLSFGKADPQVSLFFNKAIQVLLERLEQFAATPGMSEACRDLLLQTCDALDSSIEGNVTSMEQLYGGLRDIEPFHTSVPHLKEFADTFGKAIDQFLEIITASSYKPSNHIDENTKKLLLINIKRLLGSARATVEVDLLKQKRMQSVDNN